MNITDIHGDILVPKHPWAAMYKHCEKRQLEMRKLEKEIGWGLLGPDEEFHIDQRKHQYMLKDFKWRIVEELSEALEAKAENNIPHYKEELIDALVFMLNLCTVLKLVPEEVPEHASKMAQVMPGDFLIVQSNLGLAANCLKNKPWKNSEMPTDKDKYLLHLSTSLRYLQLIVLIECGGIDEVYRIFYKKQKVNDFRVESNY